MITQLRNMEEFSSRDEAEAARLLRALGPADPLPVVEQRVYTRLARPRRFGPRALRFASVATVSFVTTGILAMTMGVILHRGDETPAFTARSSLPLARVPAPAPSLASEPARPAVAAPAASLSPEAAPTVTPTPEPKLRVEPRTASRSGAVRPARVDRHPVETLAEPGTSVAPAPIPAVDPVETTEARVAAAPPEEATLVLAGLRALRRQHDPAQAGVLLARYLNRFPQGVLVQEALAISIEAGLARGDRTAAAQLAARYLELFPAGRFVRLARKAADTGP